MISSFRMMRSKLNRIFIVDNERNTLNQPFSLYLDLIRFAAALTVFVAHVSSYPFTKNIVWWRLEAYGDVAVIIFFVLSGYVIAYVTSERERTAREYFAARGARLYSVVIIALILTFLFDTIGMSANPDFYKFHKVLWKPESWAGYVSSAVFVNEFKVFGFNGISPGTNAPYWSLSFEATYYLIAGLALFFRRAIWIPVSLLILALAGKTIVALFPIWALGFFVFRFGSTLRMSGSALLILFILSAITLLLAPTIAGFFPTNNFGFWFPWGRAPFNRNLVEDYIVAMAFSGHLVSARGLLASPFYISFGAQNAIRWLGSITFPLYCIHFPAICLLGAISQWGNATFANLTFICVCTLMLVAAVTPLCEFMKRSIRRLASARNENVAITASASE